MLILRSLLLLFFVVSPAQATLKFQAFYFEDESAELTIEDVVARADSLPWQEFRGSRVYFGPTQSRIWFRLHPPVPLPPPPLLLEVPDSFLSRLELYRVVNGVVTAKGVTGRDLPVVQGDPIVLRASSHTFRIEYPWNEGVTYFLSAESVFPLVVPLRMMTGREYSYYNWNRTFLLGSIFGLLVMAVGFNGFLAISLRSRLYRDYSLFVFFLTFAFLSHEGLSRQLLWSNWTWMAQRDMFIAGGLGLLFYGLFTRDFLESRRVTPWLDRLLVLNLVVVVLGTVILLFQIIQPVAIILLNFVNFTMLLGIVIAVIAVRRGVNSARYFLLSCLCFNVAVVIYHVQESGLLWIGSYVDYAIHIGSTLEVILLSFALADRIRHVNAELATQKEMVQEAEKLSVLGRMAGEIAHEINNPLAIIHGNASLIGKLPAPEHVHELARTIEQTTMRISRVVKGIRALARGTTQEPTRPASLDSIVQDALSLCEQRKQNSEVQIDVPAINSSIYIQCRSPQICQVLVNLLNNAFDALADRSDPKVQIEVHTKGKFVEIAVVDNGPGIPRALRPRLCQPFFTTKDSGKSLGLGLSISHSIVEAHGGKIWLDENSPRTRFVFTVPLAEAPPPETE
jgi:signal transduction histidine kinase